MHAYHANYLRVDVGRGTAERCPLPAGVLRRFLGGSGLGTWLMLQEGAAEVAALDAEAPLAFVFSPLVGSPLTTSAKFAVVCKSPLTDRLNDALASSGFALAGKQTGSDAIVLHGQAAEPSVLLIDEDRIRIDPAGDLWGLECRSTERRLKERYGGGYRFAVIGPAGEQQVRYATISHDGRHAGRGGTGAVLGSKNIKAVGVRGNRRCSWADTQRLLELAKEFSRRSLGPATAKYRELGTATNLLLFNRLKTLPTRNFQQGSLPGVESLAPETLSIARERTRAYCAACTIGCEHIYSLRENGGGGEGVRLEYENIFALGPLCGIHDPEVVLEASRYCDQSGMDTISAGGTIAFAMECAERGWLDAPWLRFGSGAALLRALEEIAARRGLGDALADGSRCLAQQLGPEAQAIAPHVKGLELPGYEPRGLQTMALGLAVGARGADHNRSGAYEADFSGQADRRCLTPQSAGLAVEAEDRSALMDSLILCKFLRGIFEDLYVESANMLEAAAGWQVGPHELRRTAQRIVSAKKLFNLRAGWLPSEDTLPARLLLEPLLDDVDSRLTEQQLALAVGAYYQQRGWTQDGRLPGPLLESLDLADL